MVNLNSFNRLKILTMPDVSTSFNSIDLLLLGDAQACMHTVPEQSCELQRDVIAAYQQLRSDAAQAGFDLRIASGFRSFSRQLAIWNGKVSGQRGIVDDSGNTLAAAELSDWRCVEAILRFSALPGASRHHWGTDMDVYDAAALVDGYQLQLTLDETRAGGPFAALHRWLDERIAANRSYGFFRPYAQDLGGVAVEPWHLSFAPLAQVYLSQLTAPLLYQRLQSEILGLKSVVLANLPMIVQRYAQRVVAPAWEQ